MDQTKRPLLIPPEFSTYAEEHGIFDMYKVCRSHSLSQLKSVKTTCTQIKQAPTAHLARPSVLQVLYYVTQIIVPVFIVYKCYELNANSPSIVLFYSIYCMYYIYTS